MIRAAKRSTIILGVTATLACAAPAHADAPPPVDVVVKEAPPPGHALTIDFAPVALIVGKVAFDAVIVPGDHHALVLSPFYATTTTAPISVYDAATGNVDIQLPKQKFEGFGGELGYRYYFGLAGPRGLFVGPSLILGAFTATAQNQASTSFLDIGAAADVGYAAILGDAVSLTFGAGVQYVATSKSLPDQQLPAAVYANSAVRPRLLAAIGYAF